MDVEKKVRYRYANNSSNELVEISKAKDLGGVYRCPDCGAEMVMKCGNKNAWHFAHHKQKKCDYNHYLHTIAEIKIQDWINTSPDIYIYLLSQEYCEKRDHCRFYNMYCQDDADCPDRFNLKQWYDKCEREKRIEIGEHTFVADLLWHNKKKPADDILVEINVTHSCEEEKIQSGARIIEFNIESEEDLERIINKPVIGEFDEYGGLGSRLYTIYNFHPKERPIKDISTGLKKFILFDSNKCFIANIGCNEVNRRRGKFEVTIINDNCFEPFFEDLKIFGYALASKFFPELKHCWLCKYQTMTYDKNVICKIRIERRMRVLNCTNAEFCQDFVKGEDIIQQRLDIYKEYNRTHYVEIWKR